MRRRLIEKSYYPISNVVLTTGNGFGSVNTKIRRFLTIQKNIGSSISITQSATDGDSFTINKNGMYSITFLDGTTAVGDNPGISLNSTQLTTNINDIIAANRLAINTALGGSNNAVSSCCITMLKAGDILRGHMNGTAAMATVWGTKFEIFRIW